jgi:peptidoglycan/xylan/chitin deacetylase (PgdA/CDA1 family)
MNIRIPILTYHSIDDSSSIISMHPHKFREQMQILRDKRFNIISLNNLVNLIRNKQPLLSNTAIITFDDGFKNFYQKAYPILQEFGFSTTVFLVTGYMGKTSMWNANLRGMPVLDLLEWREVREMAAGGINFGAHTMAHQNLTKLPIEEVLREINESKLAIQNNLGQDNIFFAYPYGITNVEIKAAVQAEFQGACGTRMDFVSMHSDIYELPRIEMFYFSNNNLFKYIGTSAFFFYIVFRSSFRNIGNKGHFDNKL